MDVFRYPALALKPSSALANAWRRSVRLFLLPGIAWLPAALLPGCTAPGDSATHTTALNGQCALYGGKPAVALTLAFGLSRPNGAPVTETEWHEFLDRVVVPVFPDGLTVLDAEGRWRDPDSGPVIREASRLVWIVAPRSPDLARHVQEIRRIYEARFNQKAVAAFVHPGCVSF